MLKIEDYTTRSHLYIDLSPALDNNLGHVGIIITPTLAAHYPNNWEDRSIVRVWAQCTNIGIDAIEDCSRLLVWTTNMKEGGNMADVRVTMTHKLDASKPSEKEEKVVDKELSHGLNKGNSRKLM